MRRNFGVWFQISPRGTGNSVIWRFCGTFDLRPIGTGTGTGIRFGESLFFKFLILNIYIFKKIK